MFPQSVLLFQGKPIQQVAFAVVFSYVRVGDSVGHNQLIGSGLKRLKITAMVSALATRLSNSDAETLRHQGASVAARSIPRRSQLQFTFEGLVLESGLQD